MFNARRTYYPLSSLKEKILSKVSSLNFIMGWCKKIDTSVTRFIRKCKERKIYLNIFDYQCKNFKITRTVRTSIIEVKKIFKASSNQSVVRNTRNELGIELGEKLVIEGVINPTPRSQNQSFKFSDPCMLDSIHGVDDSLVNRRNLMGFYANGSWHSNKKDIEMFGVKPGLDLSHWQFYTKIKTKLSMLRFPVVNRIPNSNEVYSQGVNPHSDSGFYCSKIIGKTKSDNFNEMCRISKKLFDLVKQRFKPDTSLWNVGGRERFHAPDEEGNCEIRSRAVLSPEMIVSQLCQVFARPLTKGISQINEEDSFYALHLGSDLFEGRLAVLVEHCKKFKRTVCFDWSRYDQSVGEGQIVLAFAICRSAFPVSKWVDNIFLFILSSFLIKRVVGDGGIIYKLLKGVATGHPFTSIINTLINFINFSYLEVECNVNFDFKKFYGDDSILSTNNMNFKVDDLCSKSSEIFGMKLKVESDKGFINDLNVDDSACFLKIRSNFGLPSRASNDIYDTISFNRKRKIRRFDQMFARAISLLYLAPYDFKLIEILRNYCRKIRVLNGYGHIDLITQEFFDEEFNSYLSRVRCFYLIPGYIKIFGSPLKRNTWVPGDKKLPKIDNEFLSLF
jgi:hypothetical protein